MAKPKFLTLFTRHLLIGHPSLMYLRYVIPDDARCNEEAGVGVLLKPFPNRVAHRLATGGVADPARPSMRKKARTLASTEGNRLVVRHKRGRDGRATGPSRVPAAERIEHGVPVPGSDLSRQQQHDLSHDKG